MFERELLDELVDGEGVMLLQPRDVFDPAVIGIAERDGRSVAVYDAAAVIHALIQHDGMEHDEAAEFYEFNIKNAWVGEGSPLFIDLLCSSSFDEQSPNRQKG